MRLVRRNRGNPPGRPPVQIQAHHKPMRPVQRDELGDGVEEAADRVDGSAIGGLDRIRDAKV